MPRPQVRRLSADEQKRAVAVMLKEMGKSPVLSTFGLYLRFLRSRFYVERRTPLGVEVWGRITPLAKEMVLEVQRRSWHEVARGSAAKLINVIAGDTKGTFHALGALDGALRKAGQGFIRMPMKVNDGRFLYADSGEEGTVQEGLFHFFGIPIEIIAQPAVWYSYHRKPDIEEFSEDRSRVLVRFTAVSMSGESFGGTCLYARREGRWDAYPVKPSESDSMATAEAWLVKRKWKAWC